MIPLSFGPSFVHTPNWPPLDKIYVYSPVPSLNRSKPGVVPWVNIFLAPVVVCGGVNELLFVVGCGRMSVEWGSSCQIGVEWSKGEGGGRREGEEVGG